MCGNGLTLNSSPDDRNSALFKLETFADDNFNVAQKVQAFFDQVENIMGNGENAGYQHFLLFPQCFQKTSFQGASGVGIACAVKG